jgi:hypothetical protein
VHRRFADFENYEVMIARSESFMPSPIALGEETKLAYDRDELIEKALVERQLAHFLIPFRQAVSR